MLRLPQMRNQLGRHGQASLQDAAAHTTCACDEEQSICIVIEKIRQNTCNDACLHNSGACFKLAYAAPTSATSCVAVIHGAADCRENCANLPLYSRVSPSLFALHVHFHHSHWRHMAASHVGVSLGVSAFAYKVVLKKTNPTDICGLQFLICC